MLVPRQIIVHHSATVDGATYSWGAIERYHTQEMGWRDIGYHAGCEMVGADIGCLFGRPDYMAGAHTAGRNEDTLGFCFVGNYDGVGPDLRVLRIAVRRVIVPWLKRFRLVAEDVRPHREFANKTCPGKLFDMDVLRDIIREDLKRAG